eukprot:3368813-Lingulodinium_polyedra.AAC.1
MGHACLLCNRGSNPSRVGHRAGKSQHHGQALAAAQGRQRCHARRQPPVAGNALATRNGGTTAAPQRARPRAGSNAGHSLNASAPAGTTAAATATTCAPP